MNDLSDLLQDLTPVEVFDFYDGPRFYSCRDLVGQLFLVYWIEESPEQTSWLYLRTSPDRYSALKRGAISVAKALAEPEEGRAFVVQTSINGVSINTITPGEIDREWLPSPDYRLSLEHVSLPQKLVSAIDTARGANRQVLDIAFVKASNTYEIGCGKLGRLLDSLQNTIYALACAHKDVKRVPEDTKYRNEVLVTSVFASSFGVRLQTKQSDLFPDNETAAAIKLLSELVASLIVPESVSIELHRLNILARSRFKHLLQVMIDSEISIKTDWGSPDGTNIQAQATYAEIEAALQKLEAIDDTKSNIVERIANLVGVDVESDFFALNLGDKEIIKGKLAKPLSSRQFEVPSRILAKLEENCVIDPLTDKEKWSYVLLDVKALPES